MGRRQLAISPRVGSTKLRVNTRPIEFIEMRDRATASAVRDGTSPLRRRLDNSPSPPAAPQPPSLPLWTTFYNTTNIVTFIAYYLGEQLDYLTEGLVLVTINEQSITFQIEGECQSVLPVSASFNTFRTPCYVKIYSSFCCGSLESFPSHRRALVLALALAFALTC